MRREDNLSLLLIGLFEQKNANGIKKLSTRSITPDEAENTFFHLFTGLLAMINFKVVRWTKLVASTKREIY